MTIILELVRTVTFVHKAVLTYHLEPLTYVMIKFLEFRNIHENSALIQHFLQARCLCKDVAGGYTCILKFLHISK